MANGEEASSDVADFAPDDPRPPCQLYLISPPVFAPGSFLKALEEAFSSGPVAAFQLRLKDAADRSAPDGEILAAASAIRPLCAAHDVALILNDRPDLAKAAGADGVHLGQSDGSVKAARALLGPDAQIGVTCHDSRHLAMEAGDAGADYVAFGAFYPTNTKAAQFSATPDLLRWWSALMEIPCVAIGGITVENAAPLVRAGADFLAVSAGVWGHPDGPGMAVRRFNALFAPA